MEQSGEVSLRPWEPKVIFGLLFAGGGFVALFSLFDEFLWRMLAMGLYFAALGIWLFFGGIATKLNNDEALKAPDPAAALAEQRRKPKKLIDRWWVWVAAMMIAGLAGTMLDRQAGLGQPAAQTQAEPEAAAEELTIPDPITYSGYGDDYFEITPFDGLYYFEIGGNSGAHHFAVRGYDANGASTELFVNTTEHYEGYVLDPEQNTRYLEVKCEDNWTVRIMSIYTCPVLEAGVTYNGTGDDVLILPGNCKKADIRGNSSEAHFAVKAYGRGYDLLVNTTNAYEGTVRVDPEATIMTIDAEGRWAVKVYN